MDLQIGLVIAGIALAAEYMDSTLGMGYGTALTPILLIMGFPVAQVVPAVLASEFVTGLLAGFTHHRVGNVDLAPRTMNIPTIFRAICSYGFVESARRGLPPPLRVALLLGACSVIGSAIAALIAVSIPAIVVRVYIAVLIIAVGIAVLVFRNKPVVFSWNRIIGLGFLASFNKGISGGGYGPVVTAGQLTAGVDGKNAVAITSVSEAMSCFAGLVVYFFAGTMVESLPLAVYLVLGGVVSVPLSALTVKLINPRRLTALIGSGALFLGFLSLSKLVFQF